MTKKPDGRQVYQGPYIWGGVTYRTKVEMVKAQKRQEARDKFWAKMEAKQPKPSAFYTWFTTFLDEKKIDLSAWADEEKRIQIGDVCQFIVETCDAEQAKIKDMLVLIDFKNGNVYHYLTHLSQALKGPHPMSVFYEGGKSS